jgi:hypothetical protein
VSRSLLGRQLRTQLVEVSTGVLGQQLVPGGDLRRQPGEEPLQPFHVGPRHHRATMRQIGQYGQ